MSFASLSPLDLTHGRVEMAHGGGGLRMAQLIEQMFIAAFDNPALNRRNDQGQITVPAGRLVMSTDGYVIHPLFFPGGDIGSLAVHGTINDVAMAGAVPLSLSASFILEEGFPLADLQRIVRSMAQASHDAKVPVITGDTKVVERGKADGVFISTAGIGMIPDGVEVGGDRAKPGDAVLVSGSIGDHGVAIMAVRESLGFETPIQSDSAALHGLVAAMVRAAPQGLHVLRDPTRGGVAATLNEIAEQSRVGIVLDEATLPIRDGVRGACELLGLDPLYIANEGKLLCLCAADDADTILASMRAHPLGRDAARIGTVTDDPHHFVRMNTRMGGTRMVDWLAGEPLPRIC